jgi:glycosyltransferase involved in cell wall biosynthesis
MPRSLLIDVIIPMKNESSRIPCVLRELDIFMREHPGIIGRVVCVDDGSVDGTVMSVMASKGAVPVDIVQLPLNRGKWAAIHEGMRVAKNDAMLILDADCSASPWELHRIGVGFFKEMVGKRVSVFGSRFMQGSNVIGKSFLRTVMSHGYRWYSRMLFRWATGRLDVSDLQCPFKLVYKSRMLDVLEVERWSGDIELACAVQGEIVNVPIWFTHMQGGNVRPKTVVQMFFETWMVAKRFRKFRNGNGDIEFSEDREKKKIEKLKYMGA